MSKKNTLNDVFRRCLSCKKENSKRKMLRFICSTDGEIGFDVSHASNFRGAWSCPDCLCIKKAVLKDAFSKSFSKKIKVNFDVILSDIKIKLQNYILNTIGLSFRNNQCVFGRDVVLNYIRNNKNKCYLFLASDLSDKYANYFVKKINEISYKNYTIIRGLNKESIGKIFKKISVGIVIFKKGNITNHIICELDKLNNLNNLIL